MPGKTSWCVRAVCVVAVCVSLVSPASAMDIETVRVGNVGNVGEWSGESYGGYGPDVIVGGVDYVYNIGKYGVTAGQYAEFLNAVAATDAYGLFNVNMNISQFGCQITRNGAAGSYTYDFSGRPSGTEADWAVRPVNYVSWGDSARFANWLHNGQPTGAQGLSTTEDGAYVLNGAMTDEELMAVSRKAEWEWAIASEDEWYKAAYHKNDGVTGNYFDYPTSSDSMPGHDMTEATNPGNNANYYDGDYVTGSPYYRTEVGEFELSSSPYGTFDQGGNVSERNEAVRDEVGRGLRGGSFGWSYFNLHAATRSHYSVTFERNDVGFRVSNVPEPASMAILALGAVALFRRRRSG